MKKIFTLFITLGMLLSSSLQAQEADELPGELVRLNPEVIDSVEMIQDPNEYAFISYLIYYHQPLKHESPELGSLPLRAMLTITYGSDYWDDMMQMHIGGYKLDSTLVKAPNQTVSNRLGTSRAELMDKYGGHLLEPEHRFFGESCPEHPASLLGYCTAEEAAADFHALAEALKKVFKGKWAITGTSKGGGAAAIQHAFYPDDADCFVSYVAPFLNGVNDMRPQEYLVNHSWTPELRDHFLGLVKKALNRPGVFKLWLTEIAKLKEDDVKEQLEVIRCVFLHYVMNKLINTSLYKTRDYLNKCMKDNLDYLEIKGLEDFPDEVLHSIIINDFSVVPWVLLELYQNNPDNAETRAETVFSIPEDKWQDYETPYSFESVNEKGYYNLKWDYFYDTQEQIDSVNAMWQRQVDNIINFSDDGLFTGLEFKHDVFDFVLKQTAKTTKPMLFIYGGDDFWTGAHIEDQYINGDNVRRYILPEQNHAASIFAIKDEDKQEEIWQFLHKVFRNNADAIEQINQPAAGAKSRYNLMGQPTDEAQGLSIENGRVIFKK